MGQSIDLGDSQLRTYARLVEHWQQAVQEYESEMRVLEKDTKMMEAIREVAAKSEVTSSYDSWFESLIDENECKLYDLEECLDAAKEMLTAAVEKLDAYERKLQLDDDNASRYTDLDQNYKYV